MGTAAAILAELMAKPAIAWAWKRKWWIAGGIGALGLVLYIGVLKLQVAHYSRQADEWASLAEAAEATNAANVAAYRALEIEKARTEQILKARVAAKAKEADRLGAIVQRAFQAGASNACAASPAVGAVLDELRRGRAVGE